MPPTHSGEGRRGPGGRPEPSPGATAGHLFGWAPGDPRLAHLLGHPDQVTGVDLVQSLDGDAAGVRLVRLRTGEIDVDLAVDRALDVVRASVRGVPVGWLSPAGLRHPAFTEPVGFGPLRTFTGGLLTTCGLDHIHAPADSPNPSGHPAEPVRHHPLHGRVASLPARLTRLGRSDDGTRLVVEGQIRQAAPFGENLVLTRRVEALVGGRTLHVVDQIRNAGFTPAPLAVLYHANVGWPVLSPRAQLLGGAPGQSVPDPVPGAQESVLEVRATSDENGWAHAAVVNDDLGDGRAAGLLVSWDAAALPVLAQWVMPASGMYVVGVEPSTRTVLGPGEAVTLRVDLRLLHGEDDLRWARRVTTT